LPDGDGRKLLCYQTANLLFRKHYGLPSSEGRQL